MDTCIHRLAAGLTGLCRGCRDERDADHEAWREFGQHPAGEAAYRAMLEEFALDAVYVPVESNVPACNDSEVPY